MRMRPVRAGDYRPGMESSFVKSVTFDCADALVVARFWAAALGTDVGTESTVRKAFVEPAGKELVVMQDPEGNEFCVE